MRAALVAALIGLLAGGAIAWSVARQVGATQLNAALRAAEQAAEQRAREHEARVEQLEQQLRDATEAREAAEAAAAASRRQAAERIAEVRRPIPAPRRAARVAELVEAPAGDVVPYTLGGRPGFWLTEPVLIDLQAARTASASWAREREALERALEWSLGEREILAELAQQHRLAYEAEASARRQLADQVQEMAAGPPWWESPVVWAAIGVAGGAAAVVALQR